MLAGEDGSRHERRSDPGVNAQQSVPPVVVGKHITDPKGIERGSGQDREKEVGTDDSCSPRSTKHRRVCRTEDPSQLMATAITKKRYEGDCVEVEHGATVVVGVPEPGQPTRCNRGQDGPRPASLVD